MPLDWHINVELNSSALLDDVKGNSYNIKRKNGMNELDLFISMSNLTPLTQTTSAPLSTSYEWVFIW